MPRYLAPLNDIKFALHDVFQVTERYQQLYPELELDEELIDAIFEEAGKFCAEVLAPINQTGDAEGCQYSSAGVTTPAGFKPAYQKLVASGWAAFNGPTEFGGQGMPKSLHVILEEMFYAANTAFSLYPSLTTGAIHALLCHAQTSLQQRWLPKLVSGEWSGTMCLTEAHAGTDLGLLKTRAVPAQKGVYHISGSKIFITGGDQDLSENIVHLVLARLPDAPAGVKGISLFVVPKYLLDEQGACAGKNALGCGSIEHKMGIKGSSTCVMNFDQAEGYMIGEPNQGLRYMFSMMNNERLSIGLQGVGLAYTSWLNARDYALERLQSRGPLAQGAPPHSIAEHPDVRRMLMWMRSHIEAARLAAIMLGLEIDNSEQAIDSQQRSRSATLVALLTPVAKAFFTDVGFEATNHGVQILGGHGYIREWGQEQHLRDARIAQIYEGTNGIQAMDLVGRKLLADQGAGLKQFIAWAEHTAAPLASIDAPRLDRIQAALNTLAKTAGWLLQQAPSNPALAGASAVDFLHLLGRVWFAVLWAQARVATAQSTHLSASEKRSKCCHFKFFIDRVVPQVDSLSVSIMAGGDCLMELAAEEL